jgi:hypothetical protein
MAPHTRHPWRDHRRAHGPVRVADQHPTATAVQRFNARLAVAVTRVVGSMWCAYAFAAFDCISLPTAIRTGTAAIVSWIAQTFLQLVLLSIIMVGQDVQAKAADARAEHTFNDVECMLATMDQLASRLGHQDELLDVILRAVQDHAPCDACSDHADSGS